MDNQHKKITGYRDLSQSEIDGVDPRLLALAKTNLQQGFMWFVRSIAKPADPFS